MVEEFKSNTAAYDASIGNSPGASLSLILKSGTNELHGSVYEFLRNDSLDGTNFFANRSGAKKPK